MANTAAAHGQVAVLKILQKHGVNLQNINERGETPLMCSAKTGHLEAVQFLLKAGMVVGTQDKVCIYVKHVNAAYGRRR